MPAPTPSAPPHSVTCFSSNGKIIVQIVTPKGNITQVSFESSPEGLRSLAKFLQSREIEAAKNFVPKFATRSIPIQHMIDAEKLSAATERANKERFKQKSTMDQLKELDDLFSNF